MRIKLICCDVFARLAYSVSADSKHIIDIFLLPMLSHNEPELLKINLQQAVDNTPADVYNKIVMAYGLCGNSIVGLTTNIPLIIPRMHDCSAMFLGSNKRFKEVFGHRLSARWRSCGYMERCSDITDDYKSHPGYLKLLKEYGEENAEYVWQLMHPPPETDTSVYIRMPGFEYSDYESTFCKQMLEAKCTPDIVEGSLLWFERLINGPWDNSEEFLELLPGYEIEPIYDMAEIFKANRKGDI